MSDPRHQSRVDLMQRLFACTFSEQTLKECKKNGEEELIEIVQSLEEIDKEIQETAPERPLGEINKVDLAIMRLIVFESKNKNTPKKVLVDEGIELAKEFGSDSSPKFVNGVLAKILLDRN